MDLEFYHSGCEPTKGVRGLVVLMRRGVRRLLRPMFFHQVAISRMFMRRMDDLESKWMKLRAGEFDQRAYARRLALLEDQVERLLSERNARYAAHGAAPTVPLESHSARTVPRQAG